MRRPPLASCLLVLLVLLEEVSVLPFPSTSIFPYSFLTFTVSAVFLDLCSPDCAALGAASDCALCAGAAAAPAVPPAAPPTSITVARGIEILVNMAMGMPLRSLGGPTPTQRAPGTCFSVFWPVRCSQ